MNSSAFSLHAHYRRADRIMLAVLWLMFLYSLGLAAWHGTWGQALLVGGGTAAALSSLYALVPGSRLMRCCVGLAFMVMSALHINQSGGVLEMHFGIFVLLAFLVYYRDWLPIVLAAGLIAAHHLAFFALQQQGVGVYVVPQGSWGGDPAACLLRGAGERDPHLPGTPGLCRGARGRGPAAGGGGADGRGGAYRPAPAR